MILMDAKAGVPVLFNGLDQLRAGRIVATGCGGYVLVRSAGVELLCHPLDLVAISEDEFRATPEGSHEPADVRSSRSDRPSQPSR